MATLSPESPDGDRSHSDVNDVNDGFMPVWPPAPPGGMQAAPPVVKAISGATESCLFKAALSGIAGSGIGLVFGLFSGGYSNAVDKAVEMQGPASAKLRVGFKEAGLAMRPYAKSFAIFGVVFSGSECVVEKVRARHDLYNSIIAGCATGAILASQPTQSIPHRARFTQMAVGCGGMAAFSTAIDYYMEYWE
jgi:mitochondrial import inner membrane translocase subunit TIM22